MLSAPELVELQRQLTEFRFEQWKHEVLFTPQWWFLVFLLIFPWPIWVKLWTENGYWRHDVSGRAKWKTIFGKRHRNWV